MKNARDHDDQGGKLRSAKSRCLMFFALLVAHATCSAGAGVDIDGDGKSEIVVRSANAQLLVGRLVNNQFQFTTQTDLGAAYRLLGIADFDGNGKSDLAYQNITQGESGDVRIQTDFLPASDAMLRSVKRTWDVQAVGDLDGDGFADLVWRYVVPDSPDTGVSYIWFTNGTSVTQVRKRGGAPLNWRLIGAIDLNGDGADDMIYISPDRQVRLLMATANRTCANVSAGSLPADFNVLKVGDFTGSGIGELLLHNPGTGQIWLVQINTRALTLPTSTSNPDDRNASCTPSALNASVASYIFANAPGNWQFYAAGDFNGDGRADIAWLRPDGTLTLWLMNANGKVPLAPTVIDNAGVAPAGYSVLQVATAPAARSVRLEAASKTITAAAGGTISLPLNGSKATILPGTFAVDQMVTLSLLSSSPAKPPSGLLASVGPALSLSIAPASSPGASHVPAVFSAATTTASSAGGIEFTLNFSNSTASGFEGSAPAAQFIPPALPSFNAKGVFAGLPGNVDVTNKTATMSASAEMLNQFKVDSSTGTAKVNVSLVNISPELLSLPPDRFGGRQWDAAQLKWTSFNPAAIDRSKKTCMLVHGILSTVEEAFQEGTSCVNNIAAANGCTQVLGFNYRYWEKNMSSGSALADFLQQTGLSDVMIEAHSLGGPVVLAALSQPQSRAVKVSKLVTLGSPLMGTLSADKPESIVSMLVNLGSLSVGPLGQAFRPGAATLRDILNSSSLSDVSTGSTVLANSRREATRNHPPSEMEVIPIAGTGGSLLDEAPFVAAAVQAILLSPTTPAWVADHLRAGFDVSKALLNGWLFGSEQQDSIVHGSSALGIGSELNIHPGTALTFPLIHTKLACNQAVIDYVGSKVNPQSACTFSVSSSGTTFASSGGGGTVTIGTTTACSWVAVSNESWISVSSAGGIGDGAVVFTVAANNSGAPRTGKITVAGQTITITQAAAILCTYAIAPPSLSIPAAGGIGSLTVTTQDGCSWTATYSDSWIFAGPNVGTGSGTVSYSILPNTGAQRSGSITVAGWVIAVNQAASTGFTLDVTKAGTGSGTVASSPVGIFCGATCSATYANGTSVTLTATPVAGSTFAGWSGACSGTGSCIVTMNSNQTVTATFVQPNIFTGSFSGAGNFSRYFPGYTTCTFANTFSGTITLTTTTQNGITSGVVNIAGNWTSTATAGSTASFTCLDSATSWTDNLPVTISGSNISWTTTFMTSASGSLFSGVFNGTLGATTVSGSMVMTNNLSTGSATISIALTK